MLKKDQRIAETAYDIDVIKSGGACTHQQEISLKETAFKHCNSPAAPEGQDS